MLVRASELRMLDIINVTDGRRLGYLVDLDLDVETGEIKALLVPGGRGRLALFRPPGPDVEIPWHRIVKVGVDVILVELPSSVQPPQQTASVRPLKGIRTTER